MIIGKGLIASQFSEFNDDNVIIFASGVSNSSETDLNQFIREEKLVKDTLANSQGKLFIYFSTCSIYDSSKYNSPYVLHKLHMEDLIKNSGIEFLIFRVSNAVGNGGNPNLLLNYLHRSISNNDKISIHQFATRNLIDVKDVKNITLKYINSTIRNQIVNIAYKENFTIFEIVNEFINIFNSSSVIDVQKLGEHYSIDISQLNYEFEITDKKDYLINMINHYYE